MRPRGRPPTPSAMSRPSEPVEMVAISTTLPSRPSRMIEPLPKARSIWLSAASSAFVLSIPVLLFSTTRSGATIASPVHLRKPSGGRRRWREYPFCSRSCQERNMNTDVPSPPQLQRLQAVKMPGVAVARRRGNPKPWQALKEDRQRQLQLEAGERRADAEMDAGAEGDVRQRRSGGVEAVG